MDDKRKKLIDRIVKLFKLGSADANTTEAEMMLAVSKARQLMAEHAISMTDVEAFKGADITARMDARIRDIPVYTRAGKDLAPYDWQVAQAVAALTDTAAFKRTGFGELKKSSRRPQGGFGRTVSVLFVGDEDDVALAGELFHLWLTDVRKMARARYGGGNSWGIHHTSYAVGVAMRLGDRAREMVHLSNADQQTWGLVVSSKRDAITRWTAAHVRPAADKQRERRYDADALNQGYRDGAGVNMQTKIVK